MQVNCRSLIYRRNNKGPKVDPWGTLHVIVLVLEEISQQGTYFLQFLRKDPNQLLSN